MNSFARHARAFAVGVAIAVPTLGANGAPGAECG